jgi:GNAT superfamily N-acetyltransferase
MAWVAAERLVEPPVERLVEPPVEPLVEQPVEQLTDRPVAYLLVDLVDGNAHIEQVSVHPGWGRQGIGRALICHLEGWAAGQGLTAVTLTTFADVPWNGPYYRRCGFRPMTEAELGPELAALRATERARGLDRHPRLAMVKTLTGRLPPLGP